MQQDKKCKQVQLRMPKDRDSVLDETVMERIWEVFLEKMIVKLLVKRWIIINSG